MEWSEPEIRNIQLAHPLLPRFATINTTISSSALAATFFKTIFHFKTCTQPKNKIKLLLEIVSKLRYFEIKNNLHLRTVLQTSCYRRGPMSVPCQYA